MGEIADEVLEGQRCEICCMFFEDDLAPGYPRTCAECKSEWGDSEEE